jgi:ribose transport system permease protein
MNVRKIAYLLLREAGIGVALVFLCIIFAVTSPNFVTYINVMNIFTQISINSVIAVGMTFVILLGGIDLSVGSVLALCTVVGGLTMTNEAFPVWIAISLSLLISILAGAACGLFNGFVSERWKIHSFVVTLGMLNIARGAALQLSESRTIFMFPEEFSKVGNKTILGLPVIFIIALTLVMIGSIILSKSIFGRMIYAIGNNEEAVRLSGHNTMIYKITAYVICGASVGVAGIMYMLRLNMASPILGVGFELNAIAAVVLGGTSMTGGKGSLIGTFLGASIIGVLSNGLLLMGMEDFARQIVTGLIIVAAVIIDTYRNSLLNKFQKDDY